jgi:hypothetical protein
MTAYPEAYAEFQQCMLMFVYRPDHMDSPVEALWSEQARAELAGLVCRTLRQALGADLSLLPEYRNGHCTSVPTNLFSAGTCLPALT